MNDGDETLPPSAAAAELNRQLRRALEAQEFKTLEEANAFAQRFMAEYNAGPQEDLAGLSPLQMGALLSGDWETSGPLRIRADLHLAELDGAIGFVNARRLLAMLAEGPAVRLTRGGNLPRTTVAAALERLRWQDGYLEDIRAIRTVVDEIDVWPLHGCRTVLQLAGLLRRYRGTLALTRSGRRLLADEAAGELYALLFRTYFRRLNLAYLDGLADAPEIQMAVPFALWVISRLDDAWWHPDALAERLLTPDLRQAVERRDLTWDFMPLEPAYYVIRRLIEPFADLGLLQTDSLEPAPGESLLDPEPARPQRIHHFRCTALARRVLAFTFSGTPPAPPQAGLRIVR